MNPAFNPSKKELFISFIVCMFSSIALGLGLNTTLRVIDEFAPRIVVFYALLAKCGEDGLLVED